MLTLKGDNRTGTDWESCAGLTEFKLEVTGNSLTYHVMQAKYKELNG